MYETNKVKTTEFVVVWEVRRIILGQKFQLHLKGFSNGFCNQKEKDHIRRNKISKISVKSALLFSFDKN